MRVDSLTCENTVDIGDIIIAVQYLIRNRCLGYSSTTVSKNLKKTFDYMAYVNKRGKRCKFKTDDIWFEYFLKDYNLESALHAFKIATMEELIFEARNWRN